MTSSVHEDAFGQLLDSRYFGALDERESASTWPRKTMPGSDGDAVLILKPGGLSPAGGLGEGIVDQC